MLKVAEGDNSYEPDEKIYGSPPDVVMWCGSRDEQSSQDTNVAGQAIDTMSWAIIMGPEEKSSSELRTAVL